MDAHGGVLRLAQIAKVGDCGYQRGERKAAKFLFQGLLYLHASIVSGKDDAVDDPLGLDLTACLFD